MALVLFTERVVRAVVELPPLVRPLPTHDHDTLSTTRRTHTRRMANGRRHVRVSLGIPGAGIGIHTKIIGGGGGGVGVGLATIITVGLTTSVIGAGSNRGGTSSSALRLFLLIVLLMRAGSGARGGRGEHGLKCGNRATR